LQPPGWLFAVSEAPHIAHILALEPSSRGLCFVAFDKERHLIDWGGFEARALKNERCRRVARTLCCGFRPVHVVLEDGEAKSSRRRSRVRNLLRTITDDARLDGCSVVPVPREKVRQRFCVYGISSTDDIASSVCYLYPELRPRLPKKRQPWESEHYSLALFEAAALGVTFFDLIGDRK
jgi:hypothetical protein